MVTDLPDHVERAIRTAEEQVNAELPDGVTAQFDRTPVFPELAQVDIRREPRSLRDILFTHRAVAGASALEITELMATIRQSLVFGHDLLYNGVVQDAQRQRDFAREHGVLPVWERQNPGLRALLKAGDHG